MIRLIRHELRKMWSRREFLFFAALILLVNLILLFVAGNGRDGRLAPAYRQLPHELSGMTMEEKAAWVEAKYARADSIYTIEGILQLEQGGISDYTRALRQENAQAFDDFWNLYASGDYLIYTDDLYEEYYFLSTIRDELALVGDYEGYLDRIAKRAESFSGISIFQSEDGDSYEEKYIRKQAAAYEKLRGITTDYMPEKGIMSALEFSLSDVLLLAFVLLMSSVLISQEKERGMLELTFTLPAGRLSSAVAKLTAVTFSLLAGVVCLYGMNLIYFGNLYGMGSLSRSVQSLPSLVACVWKLNIGQYVLLFVFGKWLGAVVLGAWIMVCTYLFKNAFMGWAAALALIGSGFVLRRLVSAAGSMNFFYYGNLIGLLDTNDLLGRCIFVDLFGDPVFLLWVMALWGAVFGAAFCLLFTAAYSRGLAFRRKRPERVWRPDSAAVRKLRPDPVAVGKRCPDSIAFRKRLPWQKRHWLKYQSPVARVDRQERYKLLGMNGAWAVFLAFGVFLIYMCLGPSPYLSMDEDLYKDYMTWWGGRLTEDVIRDMEAENDRFAPIYALEDQLQMGNLTADQYGDALIPYQSLSREKEAYDRVVSEKIRYIQDHPGAWLVYETGYEKMFDAGGSQDIYEMLVLFLGLLMAFSSMFSTEYQDGMDMLLSVLPLGRESLAIGKLKLGCRTAAIMAALSLMPRYVSVVPAYGLPQIMAPANSLKIFGAVPGWVSIFMMLVLQVTFRIFAAVTAVCVTMFFSWKMKNTLAALFTGGLSLLLCPLLCLFGLKDWIWLSLWPVFHFPGILAAPVPIALLAMMGFTGAAVVLGTKDAVIRGWGR